MESRAAARLVRRRNAVIVSVERQEKKLRVCMDGWNEFRCCCHAAEREMHRAGRGRKEPLSIDAAAIKASSDATYPSSLG